MMKISIKKGFKIVVWLVSTSGKKSLAKIPLDAQVLPTSSTTGAAEEQVKSSFFQIAIAENTIVIFSFQLMFSPL